MANESSSDEKKGDSSTDENTDSTSPVAAQNTFANDGSFLEMFKKRMGNSSNDKSHGRSKEVKKGPSPKDSNSKALPEKKTTLPFVGKRRGGKVLKTGIVVKQKKIEPEIEKQDAWSRYMAEVNQYKQRSCTDDDKTRPLVK